MKHDKYLAFMFVCFSHFVVGEAIFNVLNASETQRKNIFNSDISHYTSEAKSDQHDYQETDGNPNIYSGFLSRSTPPFPRSSISKDSEHSTVNRRHNPLICSLHPDFCNDDLFRVFLKTSEFAEEIMEIVFDTVENFWKLNRIISKLQNISSENLDIMEFGIANRNKPVSHEFSKQKLEGYPGDRKLKEERMHFYHKPVEDFEEETCIINCKFLNRKGGRKKFDNLQNIYKYGRGNVDKKPLITEENYDALSAAISNNKELKSSRFPQMRTIPFYERNLIIDNNRFKIAKEKPATSLEEMKHRFRNPEEASSYGFSSVRNINNLSKLRGSGERSGSAKLTSGDQLNYRLTAGKGLQIKETCQCTNQQHSCRFFQNQNPDTDILPQILATAYNGEKNKGTDLHHQTIYPFTEEEEEVLAEAVTESADTHLGANFYRFENGIETLNENNVDELQLFFGNSSGNDAGLMFRTPDNLIQQNASQPMIYEPMTNILIGQELNQIQANAGNHPETLSRQFPADMSDIRNANNDEIQFGDQLDIGMDLIQGLMQQFSEENQPVIDNLEENILFDINQPVIDNLEESRLFDINQPVIDNLEENIPFDIVPFPLGFSNYPGA